MSVPAAHKGHAPRTLGFALLTVSDSRSPATDSSGDLLRDLATAAGHRVALRDVVPDEVDAIRRGVLAALHARDVDVVVTTGGTGVSPRDVTPEAVDPLLEKRLPGFGELFRRWSADEVGPAAFASRALSGVAAGKLLFILPGSPDACRLAMARLILPEAPHLVGLLRGAPHVRNPESTGSG